MKRLNMLLALVAGSFTATAQPPSAPFTVNGKISGVDKGMMFLQYSNGQKYIVDSAVIKQGVFRFAGRIAEPTLVTLAFNEPVRVYGSADICSFFLEPSAITVHLKKDKLSDAEIFGSTTQNEYKLLAAKQQKLRDRWKIVMDTLSAINKRSNVLFQETKAWALAPYHEEDDEIRTWFRNTYPHSYVTAHLLRFSYDIPTDTLKKIYARFPDKVKKSSYGLDIAQQLEKRKIGIPGTKAYAFSAMGIDGDSVRLADYKGKYVLVDFWASWCVPCRKLNPHLKELYARYKDKGFEVIGVSDDDSKPELWKKAVEKDGLPWKQVLRGMKIDQEGGQPHIDRTNDISERYNISTLPTQFLIGPDGVIIARYGGGGESHDALDPKLKEIFD